MLKTKISPIPSCSLLINSESSYLKYLLRRPRSIRKFSFISNQTDPSHVYNPAQKHQDRFQRLFKVTKSLHKSPLKVDLSEFVFCSVCLSPSKFLHIARKMRRMKYLSLNDYHPAPNPPKNQLLYWLQALPSLKKLSYNLEIRCYQKAFVKSQCKRILGYLKMQNQLESLNLNLQGIPEFFLINLLRFSQYPVSIRHLSLKGACGRYWKEKFNPEDLQLSMSKTKKLEVFQFHMESQSIHSGNFFDFIMSAPHLKFLDISIPFSLNNLKVHPAKFQGLEGVRIVFTGQAEWIPILNIFKIPSLSKVSLALSLANPSQLSLVVKYISQLKGLTSLKIKAKCSSAAIFEQETLFRNLLKHIGSIQTLKALSLNFKLTGRNPPRSQRRRVNILSGIEEIFLYGIKLEKLSLIFDEAGDEKTVLRVMELLEGAKEELVKVKIDIGRGELKIKEVEKFIGFIRGMRFLEVLKINCLNFDGRASLKEFVEVIEGMERLKKLRFGKIDEGIEGRKVIESVERMLGKKGLRTFECEIAKKWMMKEGYSVSCWKTLKRNPELEYVDRRLQIFKGNWVKRFVFCRPRYYWF